jgi:hypothetical protein
MSPPRRSSKGWQAMGAITAKSSLRADTEVGPVLLRANVRQGNGDCSITVHNADQSWTKIAIDAEGKVVLITRGKTEKEARDQMVDKGWLES